MSGFSETTVARMTHDSHLSGKHANLEVLISIRLPEELSISGLQHGQSVSLCHLSNQTGEHKDAREKVSHLKGNLKDGMRFVETPDVDQTADGIVVTAQVPVERGEVD